MKWTIAIILPYLVAVVLFFSKGTPIWPGLLACCAVAACKKPSVGVAFAVPVLLMQYVKVTYPTDHLWVYYGAIYVTLGVLFVAIWDRKVMGPAALLIGTFYLLEYFGQPRAVLDVGTELTFILALCLGVFNGFSGGLFSDFRTTSDAVANRSLATARRVRSDCRTDN